MLAVKLISCPLWLMLKITYFAEVLNLVNYALMTNNVFTCAMIDSYPSANSNFLHPEIIYLLRESQYERSSEY